jgi:hypothetical protein
MALLLAAMQGSAEPCASLSDFGKMLGRGDIAAVKQAIGCGVDPHAQGDKALLVALRGGHHELAKYLEELGLKPNPEFLRAVWGSSWSRTQVLENRIRIYRLDNGRDPDPERLREQLAKYAQEDGQSHDLLKDTWGHSLVIKITPPSAGSVAQTPPMQKP